MPNVSQIKLPNNTTYDIDAKTVNGKTVESNVPSGAVFTDTNDKVKQTNTNTDASYNILFSSSTNTTTEKTEGAGKSAHLQYNPNKAAVSLGDRGTGDVGTCSLAAGQGCVAAGNHSVAMGYGCTTGNSCAVAMGDTCSASGRYSHAIGYHCSTTSSAYYQHAEGQSTTASGDASHSEGGGTTAVGDYSHAQGLGTYATSKSQHVFGEYNIKDGSDSQRYRGEYVEVVGCGDSETPKNARTLSWTGNEWLLGSLTTTDVIKSAKWDGTNTSLKDAITAIYLRTLCYSASISRGSGWTQRSTSTAFPSSTTGTYLFMTKDSNGTIYSRIPVPATDFAGTTSTRPLIVRSNGTSSDANNIMVYWGSTTKFYTYAGSSSMPTGTFTLVVHYTPLNI